MHDIENKKIIITKINEKINPLNDYTMIVQ